MRLPPELQGETMTPVAEYLGVAILERGGKVEKEFNGKKYTTDGRIYIIRKVEGDRIEASDSLNLVGFETERALKEQLEGCGEAERSRYMDYREVWSIFKVGSPWGTAPLYVWSEEQGTFVFGTLDNAHDGVIRRPRP